MFPTVEKLPTVENLSPVGWLPAGLISWYGPDGRPMALVIGWMSLVCSATPRLRSAWDGARVSRSCLWPGGDFVLNVPGQDCLKQLQSWVACGQVCLDAVAEFNQSIQPALAVKAPRLTECDVQVECRNGVVEQVSFEPEIVGEVVLLHRADEILDAAQVFALCARDLFANPLSA